ncbi:MAG: fibronectin type III domain-containing protein [Calditrichaeota bacterium]|nr:fibronectin type III domain-containing protein [Calditrichota bacterium]
MPRTRWAFPLIVALAVLGFLLSCSKKSTEPEAPTRPSAPSELVGIGADTTAILLSWRDNSNNEDGFRIYHWDGVQWTRIGATATDSTTYLVTGLWPGGEYNYRVTAFNTIGESDFSNTATLRPAPVAPANVTLQPQGHNRIVVSWTDMSTGELGFAVQRRTQTHPFAAIDTTLPNDTTYNDTTLAAETLCYYRIGAVGQISTAWSEEDSARTWPYAVPAAPTNLRAEVIEESGVQLVWIDNSPYDLAVHIYRNRDGTGYVKLDSISAVNTTYLDRNVEDYHRYAYRVFAVNAVGSSEGSNEASAYWGPSSSGAIPLVRDNLWQYNVRKQGEGAYEMRVIVSRVDFFGSIPWFLINETNVATGKVDTTYYLRNEIGQGVMRREQGSSNVVLLWRYPANEGDYYHVDGDCVRVFTVTGTIQVPAGNFDDCYGYERFRDDGTIEEIFLKPKVGIARVRTYDGATMIYEQALYRYTILGP